MSKMLRALFGALLLGCALFLTACCGGGDYDGSSYHAGTQASVRLADARSGRPVVSPVYTENGVEIGTRCLESNEDGDCVSQILPLRSAIHSIGIYAVGYRATTIEIDTRTMDSVHLAIDLVPNE